MIRGGPDAYPGRVPHHRPRGSSVPSTVSSAQPSAQASSPGHASVWPRLEPLLSGVQKPIQYVGGELNSTLKDWDDAEVRWALMYPDAYEVGLPNQGVQILYEVLNERDWALAERTYAVWSDMEAGHAGQRHPAVHRRPAPARPRLRCLRHLLRHRARLHEHADRTRPGRGSPCTQPTAVSTTRWCWPAGTPRSTPSRSPTSSTPLSWATASAGRGRSPGFRAGRRAFPGRVVRPQWLTRVVRGHLARSQWRDRAGFAPDFP